MSTVSALSWRAPTRVILIIGASQGRVYHAGTGAATSSNVPSNLQAADSGIKIWDGSAWSTLVNASNNNPLTSDGFTDEWGLEGQFAYNWRQDHPTEPIYIIKYCRNATSVSSNWSSGQADFVAMTGYVNAAMALAPTNAIVDALFCTLGGTDSTTTGPANAYQTNLVSFLGAARTAWCGGRKVPFICDRLNANIPTGTFVFRDTVRTKQNAFIADTGNVNCWMINTDAYTLQSDSTHYAAASIPTFGNDFYACYKGTYVFTP